MHKLHKMNSRENPPPYSRANTDESFGPTSPFSETSQESTRSSTSNQTDTDSMWSKSETPVKEKGNPIETELSKLLVLAIANKDKYSVRARITEGAQILFKNNEGCCSLHLAIRAGDKEVLRELLKSKELEAKPEGVDAVDNTHATALHYAASAGEVKLAIKLLDVGANVNAVNKHNRSVLYMALKANKDKFVEMLIERGAKEEPNLSGALSKRYKQMQATVRLREKDAKKKKGG